VALIFKSTRGGTRIDRPTNYSTRRCLSIQSVNSGRTRVAPAAVVSSKGKIEGHSFGRYRWRVVGGPSPADTQPCSRRPPLLLGFCFSVSVSSSIFHLRLLNISPRDTYSYARRRQHSSQRPCPTTVHPDWFPHVLQDFPWCSKELPCSHKSPTRIWPS
jgi:hypothetical protein